MATDLSNVQVGDKLALRNRRSQGEWFTPPYRILVVERITATQVGCRDERGGSGEWRFRKSDGKQFGENYVHAEIATNEVLAAVALHVNHYKRRTEAQNKLKDLIGKEYHQLGLSLEQIEALAKAWEEVKSIGAKF